MLKEQASLFRKGAIILDGLTIIAAFLVAYELRFPTSEHTGIIDYFLVIIVFLPAVLYLMSKYRLYASLRTCSLGDILISLTKTHVIAGLLVAAGVFLIDHRALSRGFIVLFLMSSLVLLSFQKGLVRTFLRRVRTRGYNFRNILVVGTGKMATRFAETIVDHSAWGLRIVGFLHEAECYPGQSLVGIPVLGPITDLLRICKTTTVDEVVFCLSSNHLSEIDDYIPALEELGVTVRVNLGFLDTARTNYDVSIFHDEIPLLSLYCRSFCGESLLAKRCLDIVGGLVGMLLLGLLLPFIAVAIKLDSPGPIFFGQNRVGERGRSFTCWKFRSMSANADQRKQDLVALNEVKGAMFKIKDDPRITRVGRILRKTSLDEFPQFWNVLRGEMSLVGTRPPTPDEVEKYENWHHRRICIKPGLTGLWQVSGRNQVRDFDEIVKLDLRYIDSWSLWGDLKIILKTMKVIFSRDAY